VPREAFPKKYVRGLPPYDLPLILLARLAVDRRFVGRRLGHALISEAFRISLRAADEVGCRCMITDAYKDRISWYARNGSVPIEGAAESGPQGMFLGLRTIRAAVGRWRPCEMTILYFGVTSHLTAEWTVTQQMRDAFPSDTAPRYLQRDHDGTFGREFVEQVKAMGTKQVLSAPAVAVATSICGTGDRYVSPRVPGPHDRIQRAQPIPICVGVPKVLSSESHPFGAKGRQSPVAAGAIVGVGTNRVDSDDRRPPSSVRTPSRLNGSRTSSFPDQFRFVRLVLAVRATRQIPTPRSPVEA
jgi:hypothetical protein